MLMFLPGFSIEPQSKTKVCPMKKTLAVIAMSLVVGNNTQAANIASGSLWHVPEAISQNAIPANVPATAPDVTFDVFSPFNFAATSATVQTWLNSSSAFNIVEHTSGALASLMDNGAYGTLLEFTGDVSVVNGQKFTVTHDDGLTLVIGGVDLGFNAGPTPPTTTIATYTGPTGTFPFQLVYGECCGGPAVLQVDLPFQSVSRAPDGGSTLVLAGLGSLALLGLSRRLRPHQA